MSAVGQSAKRVLDVSVAGALVLALAPVMLATALMIRADSRGPVFFRQERLGRGGRTFRIWKFRTMKADADVRVDARGKVVNTSDDPRHTAVGRTLRRWSVDELPQLFNVLVGDMSLVGPRPDLPGALDLYAPHQRKKLEVRPGITGLAQVRGRNELDPAEKWDLDAQYAARAGLWLDLRLLAETARQVVLRKSIYADARNPGNGGR